MKLRLLGQVGDWQVTGSVKGGGSDPRWPMAADPVKAFPFVFVPTPTLRALCLEVEVWSEDTDGVDSCVGCGTLELTQLARCSADSQLLPVSLRARSGTPAGDLIVSLRSDVKGTERDVTLSPETQEQLSFFKSVSLFHTFTEEQLLVLTRRIVVRTYEPGTVIVKQGDIGDEFFVVHVGKVRFPVCV